MGRRHPTGIEHFAGGRAVSPKFIEIPYGESGLFTADRTGLEGCFERACYLLPSGLKVAVD
jgi:hypothetical protein